MKKQLAYEKAYDAIKHLLRSQRFLPGIRINVEKLSRELGVSRVPVWEAIRRLEQEGIVRNVPHRGVFFVEDPLDSAEEVIEVRLQLERLVAIHAVKNPDKGRLARMARCLEAQYDAVMKGDVSAYSLLDIKFHSILIEFSGNKFLRETLEGIASRMVTTDFRIADILADLYKGHYAIYEALQKQDAQMLDQAILGHNELTLEKIRQEAAKTAQRKKTMESVGRIGADGEKDRGEE